MAKKQSMTLEQALQVILATDGDNPLCVRIQRGHFSPRMRMSVQHDANVLADLIGEHPGDVALAG